ncbi:MAG: PCYCGC motif-containing (lipo)protein [Gemmatimonadota bacterium]
MPNDSRRVFLKSSALLAAALTVPRVVRASAPEHPAPRDGVTGAKVLSKDDLVAVPHLVALFDGIRAIPAIADGIRCYCGCAALPGFYSLLSCYEGDGMARVCPVCQGEGRVAVRLHKEGKSLREIRVAIDAQYA